jgi:hypothetical protein
MSGAVFTLGNSVSGSLSLGSALSKFGRVAGQAGFTIEQDEETLNNTVTSRYAGLAAVTVSGVTSVLNPSLVLIPSAYNTSGSTGILYSLHSKPNGVADFVVTRATEGTRFNSVGRISSVGSGDARLDYLTSGGTVGPPALLVEPSAANGILNSENTATNWTLGANLTSGYTDVIGVSGNNLTVAASGSGIGSSTGALRRISNNVALASGSTYTISFLMRQTGTHTIGGYYASITGGAAGDLGGGFNVSGSFSSGSLFVYTGATNRIRRVERFGADVYRCSETFTMTASGTLTTLSIGPTISVTWDANSAIGTTMAFAAPQIELGSVPTTFIPTTTAAVTRAADVIRASGVVSGCIGQSEGTVYFEVEVTSEVRDRWFCSLDSSANSFIQMVINPSNAIIISILNGGSTVITNLTSSALSVGYHKVAFAYNSATNGCIMYIDGVQNPVATRTVVAPGLPAFNNMSFGTYFSTTTDTLKGRVRAGALYTTRLTDAQLSALTTI